MPIKYSSQTLWTLVATIILISLVALDPQLKQHLYQKPTLSIDADPLCNLRAGSCTTTLPAGGTVSFGINPPSIPLLQLLELKVVTEGIDVSSVEVDLVGIGMDMGYNHTQLVAQDTQANHFKGNATIPICIRNRMDWEAKVLLQTKQGLINVPFRFYTIQ